MEIKVSRALRLGYSILVCYCLTGAAHGFLPNNFHQCFDSTSEPEKYKLDHTHHSLILLAVETVATQSYGMQDDTVRGLRQDEILQQIVAGSDYLDRNQYQSAALHFNGEQILQGNTRLIEIQWEVVRYMSSGSVHRYDTSRHLLGQALHLVQDFYSNTDWVEIMKGGNFNHFYQDLGVANKTFVMVDTERMQTACIGDSPDALNGNHGNVAHVVSWISSGYRSDQDIIKPPGRREDELLVGKCSHGGQYDESRYQIPQGGINSESFDYNLSPKAYLHDSSSTSALLSTVNLLNNPDGILAGVPANEMAELLGVVSTMHLTLALTEQLKAMTSQIRDSNLSLKWKSIHVYTGDGDYANDELDIWSYLEHTPVDLTQRSIIEQSLTVPEGSTVVIVTGGENPISGSWDEDILKKSLTSRSIHLHIFYIVPAQGLSENLVGVLATLRRVCLSTSGHLFSISSTDDFLKLMSYMDPGRQEAIYERGQLDVITVPCFPHIALSVMINCEARRQQQADITLSNQEDSLQPIIVTDYVTVYDVITSLELPSLLTVSDIASCTVSSWSKSQPILKASPVSIGPRSQKFSSRMGDADNLQVAVTIGKEFGNYLSDIMLSASGAIYPLSECLYNESRSNTGQTFLSTELSSSNKVNWVDTSAKLVDNGPPFTVRDYITSQQIHLSADTVIENQTVVAISNNSSTSTMSYTIQAYHEPSINVQITPQAFVLPHTGSQEVEIKVNSIPASGLNIRPIIVSVTGISTHGEEFHSVHSFISITKGVPLPSTIASSSTTTTTSSTTSTMSTRPSTSPTTTTKATPTTTTKTSHMTTSSEMTTFTTTTSTAASSTLTTFGSTTNELALNTSARQQESSSYTTGKTPSEQLSDGEILKHFFISFSVTFFGLGAIILIIASISYYIANWKKKIKDQKPRTDLENNSWQSPPGQDRNLVVVMNSIPGIKGEPVTHL